MNLLAVDPGSKHHGVAYFEGGVLRYAGLVERPDFGVWAASDSLPAVSLSVVHQLVIEQPHKQSRTVNFNVLTQLACAAGEVAGVMIGLHGLSHANVRYIWASHWKGTLDKPKSHARIRAELGSYEHTRIAMPRAVKTLGHNVWDAIGIGLWATGRLKKGSR